MSCLLSMTADSEMAEAKTTRRPSCVVRRKVYSVPSGSSSRETTKDGIGARRAKWYFRLVNSEISRTINASSDTDTIVEGKSRPIQAKTVATIQRNTTSNGPWFENDGPSANVPIPTAMKSARSNQMSRRIKTRSVFNGASQPNALNSCHSRYATSTTNPRHISVPGPQHISPVQSRINRHISAKVDLRRS